MGKLHPMDEPPAREELHKELAEARLHLDELTRQLDESMGAEEGSDETIVAELERARARLVRLEAAAERLGTTGT